MEFPRLGSLVHTAGGGSLLTCTKFSPGVCKSPDQENYLTVRAVYCVLVTADCVSPVFHRMEMGSNTRRDTGYRVTHTTVLESQVVKGTQRSLQGCYIIWELIL